MSVVESILSALEVAVDYDAVADLGCPCGPASELRDGRGRLSIRGVRHERGWMLEVISVGLFVWPWAGPTVFAIPSGAAGEDLADHYRRSVTPLLLQAQGIQSLHASAVVFPAGVVAFCGASGVGKSTVAAFLRRRGLQVSADDTVVFGPGERGVVECFGLSSRLRLLPAAHARLTPIPSTRDKLDVRPLASVVILCPSDEGPSLELVAGVDSLVAVLGQANCLSLNDVDQRRSLFEACSSLAASVPVWRLHFVQKLDRLEGMVTLLTGQFGSSSAMVENAVRPGVPIKPIAGSNFCT